MRAAALRQPDAIRLLRSYFPTSFRIRRRYRLPTAERSQPYYIYYPGSGVVDEPWKRVTFDRDGVVVTPQGYNPVTVAQYALYSHERMVRNVAGSDDAFRANAEYLRVHQRDDGALSYSFALPKYGVERGFISAMAQGTAASVFARHFALTDDARWADAAVLALEPLKRDVAGGGCSFIRDGAVFFEEVATDQPVHILNGHLFAAFGVWDLARFGLADPALRALHDAAVETLRRWLPRFEDRGWSYYQLATRAGARHYAHIIYHHLHIAQLQVYAAMTGVSAFAETARRWEEGLRRFDLKARVWLDSASWLTERARYRLGFHRSDDRWHAMTG
jgi:heparosan-N-sulfate-glucuronate 5-epimerase